MCENWNDAVDIEISHGLLLLPKKRFPCRALGYKRKPVYIYLHGATWLNTIVDCLVFVA